MLCQTTAPSAFSIVLICLTISWHPACLAQESGEVVPVDLLQLWKKSERFRVLDGGQLIASINLRLSDVERRRGELVADQGSSKGGESVEVYRSAAPAIVYVTDGESGHGSGFFLNSDGWILTNHHVVEGMPFDPETGVRVARIVTGRLDDDGAMSANDGFFVADVYAMDELRDLALLRLRTGQEAEGKWRGIELADASPPPGTLCIAIGHPSQGVLWTLREGEVAGRGQFPKDQIGDFFIRGADAGLGAAIDEMLENMPSRKVLLSSCGLNPGDSGGPLLDAEGRLVAVSFAVPVIDPESGVDLGKFSYHVHLDEVKTFLGDWPDQPLISPPDNLPPAEFQTLADVDGDGHPETWLFGLAEDSPPTGMFVDLDADTDPEKVREFAENGMTGATPAGNWDWEIAFCERPYQSVSFDRNGDGEADLVLVMQRDNRNIRFDREEDGNWKASAWDGDLKGEKWFDSEKLQGKFRSFLRRLG